MAILHNIILHHTMVDCDVKQVDARDIAAAVDTSSHIVDPGVIHI